MSAADLGPWAGPCGHLDVLMAYPQRDPDLIYAGVHTTGTAAAGGGRVGDDAPRRPGVGEEGGP